MICRKELDVEPGRNDPCPCGSGLKYKRCCWQKNVAAPAEPKAHDGAITRALAWLTERHRKGFRAAVDELVDSVCTVQEQEVLARLDETTREGIDLNLMEWLLAEGEMMVAGASRRISDCLLDRGGPLLTIGQRDWLQKLSEHPLRLYDVTDVVPGVQITLCDALDTDCMPITVLERSGSQTLQVGTKAAFRIVPVQGHHELSGAAYPFSLLMGPVVAGKLQNAVAKQESVPLPQMISRMILREWLQQYVAPPPMPTVMDAHSGEPIRLITDHYRVIDWERFVGVLANQADVHGDERNGWQRLLECDDGQARCIAGISVGKRSDRIEVFYKTERYAEEGRRWFDALVDRAAVFLTRELTNPWKASASVSKAQTPSIDGETMALAIEQVLHRTYANWADEPIPALGNKTPREAICTPAGLERVKGLLRSYEDGEERQAAEQGRREISYQFLWDALGVAR